MKYQHIDAAQALEDHPAFDAQRANIEADAQKAAWIYATVDDACPYPFGTAKAVIFKEAFLAAQRAQQDMLTAAKSKPQPIRN